MQILPSIFFAVALLFLLGCATYRPDVALETTAWSVEDLDGRGVSDRAFPTVTFRADGQVTGSTGCNEYFGTYRVDGDQLIVGTIGQTKRACEEALMAQESRFLSLFEGQHTVELTDADRLVLAKDEGSMSLVRVES